MRPSVYEICPDHPTLINLASPPKPWVAAVHGPNGPIHPRDTKFHSSRTTATTNMKCSFAKYGYVFIEF